MGYLHDTMEKLLSKQSKKKGYSPNAVRALYLGVDAFVVEYHPVKGFPSTDYELLNPAKVEEDVTKGALKSPLQAIRSIGYFMLEEVYIHERLLKTPQELSMLMIQGGFHAPDFRLRAYGVFEVPQGWFSASRALFDHEQMKSADRPVGMLMRGIPGSGVKMASGGEKLNYKSVVHLSPVHYEADKEGGAVRDYFDSLEGVAAETDGALAKLNGKLVAQDVLDADQLKLAMELSEKLKSNGYEVVDPILHEGNEVFRFESVGLREALAEDKNLASKVMRGLPFYAEQGKDVAPSPELMEKLEGFAGKDLGYMGGSLSLFSGLRVVKSYVDGSKLDSRPRMGSPLNVYVSGLVLADSQSRAISLTSKTLFDSLVLDEETKSAILKAVGRPKSYYDVHEFMRSVEESIEAALPGISEVLKPGTLEGIHAKGKVGDVMKAFGEYVSEVNKKSPEFSKSGDWAEVLKILKSDDMDSLISFYEDVEADGDSHLKEYIKYYIPPKNTLTELLGMKESEVPERVREFLKKWGYLKDSLEIISLDQFKENPRLCIALSPEHVFDLVIRDNKHRIPDKVIPSGLRSARDRDLFARKFLHIRIR